MINYFPHVDSPVVLFKICLMAENKYITLSDGILNGCRHNIEDKNTTQKEDGKGVYIVVRF